MPGTSYILTVAVPGDVPRAYLEYMSGEIERRSPHLVNLGLAPPAWGSQRHVMRFRVYAYGLAEVFGICAHVMHFRPRPDSGGSPTPPGTAAEVYIVNESESHDILGHEYDEPAPSEITWEPRLVPVPKDHPALEPAPEGSGSPHLRRIEPAEAEELVAEEHVLPNVTDGTLPGTDDPLGE